VAELDIGLLLGLAWDSYRQVLRRRLAEAGFNDLRPTDGDLFRMLYHTGGMTATQIAQLLGVTRQAASKAIDSLQRRGYAVRERPAGGDGRERLVRLTQRGHDIRAAAIAIGDDLEAELRRTTGAAVIGQMRSGLGAIVDASASDPAPLLRALRALERDGQSGPATQPTP
jgi:DNA-binding MarR family transcriptional regulator